jgi:hypothetical protein
MTFFFKIARVFTASFFAVAQVKPGMRCTTLHMERVCSSELLLNIYQSIPCHAPEDGYFISTIVISLSLAFYEIIGYGFEN